MHIDVNSFICSFTIKKIDVNLDFYDKLSYNDATKSEQFYKLLTVKSRKELNYFKNSDRRLANYVKSVLELSNGGKDGME